MALKDSLRNAWKKHELRQGQRAMAPMMDQVSRNILGAEARLLNVLGDNGRAFIMAKWRLTPKTKWKLGEVPRRPLDDRQLADLIGVDVERIRSLDGKTTDVYRDVLAKDSPYGDMFEWLTVPIDQAQAWWDEKYGKSFMPDGGYRGTCAECGVVGESDLLEGRVMCECGRAVKVVPHVTDCPCGRWRYHAWYLPDSPALPKTLVWLRELRSE